MEFAEMLRKKKGAVQENWMNKIFDSYPSKAASFYRSKKNEFLNPVGTTLSSRIEAIIDSLSIGFDRETLSSLLEDVIKIRAVQDFSPSQALAFLPLLKTAFREELGTGSGENELRGELQVLEARVDQMTLLAFDIYTDCRQRIYQLRIDELKRLQGTPRSRRAEKEALANSKQNAQEAGGYQ